jgi:hypothetical protein
MVPLVSFITQIVRRFVASVRKSVANHLSGSEYSACSSGSCSQRTLGKHFLIFESLVCCHCAMLEEDQ